MLPTGGVARTRGGLSVSDFVKCISVQEVSRAGVARLAPVVEEFAHAEGLDAHERAVEVRQVKTSAKTPVPVRRAVERMRPYNPPLEGRTEKLRLDFNENPIGCSPAVRRALAKLSRRIDFLLSRAGNRAPQGRAPFRRCARTSFC